MELFLNRFELYDLTLYNILRLSSKTEIILNRKRRRRMEIKRDYYLNKLIRKKRQWVHLDYYRNKKKWQILFA